MTTKLFQFKNRDEAHAALAQVIGTPEAPGVAPLAECRERMNEEFPYQVWDGTDEPPPAPPTPEPPKAAGISIRFSPEELAAIGQAMAAAMKGGG